MNRIEITNGKIAYTDNNILFDKFNLSVSENEFLVILGKTGIGKSTILRIISGLEKLKKGNFNVRGSLSLCFQDSRLFPNMTVFENIAYPLKIKRYEKNEILREVTKIITDFKIESIKDRYVDSLSGGEIKRVALARCIITKPEIILLDEPTSNLDFEVKIEMRELIKNIHYKNKCTIVMVTHDIFDSLYLSDKILILGNNKIISYVDTMNVKNDVNAMAYFKPFINELSELNNALNIDNI